MLGRIAILLAALLLAACDGAPKTVAWNEYQLGEGGSMSITRDGIERRLERTGGRLIVNDLDVGAYEGEPIWVDHDGTVFVDGTVVYDGE